MGKQKGARMSKRVALVLGVAAVVLAAAAPALAQSGSANNSGHAKDFSGLVNIGGGREMYMECQGTGYPTVVFVAGAQDRAETWSTTKDPSEQAVFPAIAETNRVCAYDRPGTILATGEGEEDFKPSRSDPVDQPTTLQDHVDDLHALLQASGEARPLRRGRAFDGRRGLKALRQRIPPRCLGARPRRSHPLRGGQLLTDEQWDLWKPLLGCPCPPSEEALDLYPAPGVGRQ